MVFVGPSFVLASRQGQINGCVGGLMSEALLKQEIDESETADDVRVCGKVKWFDAVRGYGFVVPDDGSSDVLVHFTVLREVGRRTLPEGATVTCLAVQRDRGRQARKILELDLATSIGPDPEAALQRAASRVDPLDLLESAGPFEPVTVKWFN